MSLLADLKIMWHMAARPIRGRTHQDRLESFYKGQAGGYDDFRKRLLHGRQELYQELPTPEGGRWLELGGGTASNLEYLGERIAKLRRLTVVDLSPSLLEVAAARAARHGWTNVETLVADVTTVQPEDLPADVCTFSYSLTMIPDWFAAIDHAVSLLRPGGVLGVVDFYVSRKYPAEGHRRHPWSTRHFWPTWFGTDNVHPSFDHVPYLHRRLEPVSFVEGRGKVPWLPFVRAPFYRFIGRKRGD